MRLGVLYETDLGKKPRVEPCTVAGETFVAEFQFFFLWFAARRLGWWMVMMDGGGWMDGGWMVDEWLAGDGPGGWTEYYRTEKTGGGVKRQSQQSQNKTRIGRLHTTALAAICSSEQVPRGLCGALEIRVAKKGKQEMKDNIGSGNELY